MSKQSMREETERLVKEAMERNLAVKQGKTRLDVKCGKCGAPNRVFAAAGREPGGVQVQGMRPRAADAVRRNLMMESPGAIGSIIFPDADGAQRVVLPRLRRTFVDRPEFSRVRRRSFVGLAEIRNRHRPVDHLPGIRIRLKLSFQQT